MRVLEAQRIAEIYCVDLIECQDSHNSSRRWQLWDNFFPSDGIVFFNQVIIIYVVIAFCPVNFSLCREDSNL